MAQTFRVQVMQPARTQGERVRFPVVYATDANLAFDMLKGISHLIQTNERDAPRFILVGIGYPRIRLQARDVEGVLVAREGMTDYYGAEDFQQFIRHEVIPLIDAKYETEPGERTYFGHSAGGGFGLFTLFTQPDLFRNYILSSPGLIYHGESSAGIAYDNHEFALEYARKFIRSGRMLERVSAYLSVGTEEEFEPGLEQWRLTSSFFRMAHLIRGASIPGLRFFTEVFAGETHMTVWPMAFIHGIRTIFRERCGV